VPISTAAAISSAKNTCKNVQADPELDNLRDRPEFRRIVSLNPVELRSDEQVT
jgi:hypothetical protein